MNDEPQQSFELEVANDYDRRLLFVAAILGDLFCKCVDFGHFKMWLK